MTENTQNLGQLVRIKRIQSIWPSEPQDFTPWLAQEENIAILSETLGFGADGLELVRTETAVGTFRGDILCRTTGPSATNVLIENQYGRSDHDHLGKLLTYAAGEDAEILIWLAEEIREEHEAAITLLNSVTEEDFQVFGVEIELWRINDSPPAPRFNIVAKPNTWVRHAKEVQRAAASRKELTTTQAAQLAYWSELQSRLIAARPPFNPVSPQPASWIQHSIGKAGVSLNLATSRPANEIRVEIYLSGETAKGYFHILKREQESIEAALGMTLDWQELPTKKDARICIPLPSQGISAPDDWENQHTWLVSTIIAFYKAFEKPVRALNRETGIMLG
jgi:hypothetical protein